MTVEDIPALEEQWKKVKNIRNHLDLIAEQLNSIDRYLSRDNIEHKLCVKFIFANGPEITWPDLPIEANPSSQYILLVKDFLLREEAHYLSELEEL